MNPFLPLWPHIPTLCIHTSGGRGRGGALILDRCRVFDLFASVDAHLCKMSYFYTGCPCSYLKYNSPFSFIFSFPLLSLLPLYSVSISFSPSLPLSFSDILHILSPPPPSSLFSSLHPFSSLILLFLLPLYAPFLSNFPCIH
jgi:hypothetical protein